MRATPHGPFALKVYRTLTVQKLRKIGNREEIGVVGGDGGLGGVRGRGCRFRSRFEFAEVFE